MWGTIHEVGEVHEVHIPATLTSLYEKIETILKLRCLSTKRFRIQLEKLCLKNGFSSSLPRQKNTQAVIRKKCDF